jgi:hypothetical protein
MEIKNVYPKIKTHNVFTIPNIKHTAFIIFVIASIICAVVNICVGGKAWSVVVIASMFVAWSCFRPLVENLVINRITKIILKVIVLLILINAFLISGWAFFVVPIVCFSLLILLNIIYYAGYKWQKKNIMSLYFVIAGSIIAIICALCKAFTLNWPTIVLGSLGAGLLIINIACLRKTVFREFIKRFHLV